LHTLNFKNRYFEEKDTWTTGDCKAFKGFCSQCILFYKINPHTIHPLELFTNN